MLGRGIKIGKILGIEIYVDFSWLIIFVLLLWSLSRGFYPVKYPNLSESTYIIMGAISALLLFACVLLHELSHSIIAQRSGIPVPRITLFIFGGVAQISEEPREAGTEFNVAIAGPICSLILAALFYVLSKTGIFAADVRFIAVFEYLAIVNLVLVIFNMIPGFPLDGGRILRAYLWNRWKDIKRATFVVSKIGSSFGITLIILGGLIILAGNLISGIWFIFIGMFLNNAAKTGYQTTVLKYAMEGVRIKDVMTRDVVTVSPDITLSDLVRNYFYKYIFLSFPVIDDRDRFLGLISLRQVKEYPQSQWGERTVEEVMVKASELKILSQDDDAMDALNALMTSNVGRIPILKDERLVGILTRRDIMTLLTIKTDLG